MKRKPEIKAQSLSETRALMLGVDKVHAGAIKMVLMNRGKTCCLHGALVGGIMVSSEPFGFETNEDNITKTEFWECEIILIPKRKFRDENGAHLGTLESVMLNALAPEHPVPFNDGVPYERDGKPVE